MGEKEEEILQMLPCVIAKLRMMTYAGYQEWKAANANRPPVPGKQSH
jgi:hypothetical protein